MSGTITTFDAPDAGNGNGQGTLASAINTSGVITGDYFDAQNRYHGFVRSATGTLTEFDYPGATRTSAYGINTAGTVTGWYVDVNGVVHGFVRTKKAVYTSFDGPNNPIPNQRLCHQHGGSGHGPLHRCGGGVHGFERAVNGTITTFDPPGTGVFGALVPGGFKMDINTAGDVAGYWLDSGSVYHGYLFVP